MRLFTFFLIVLLSQHLSSQSFSGGFPFLLPARDTLESSWLPDFNQHAIGAADRIGTDTKGNFTRAGQPYRFWGVNIVAAAAFPQQQQSPWIAGRLRKMGVNLVRFHHIDNGWWYGDAGTLFERSKGTRILNPVTLFILSTNRFCAKEEVKI